ncbi:MAG TPA: phosphoenolpyruvate--protein phosphotransferase [Terrimesophilobacter sp.]|nr:phosphoenolpyruvate--protein phosphotransferase [Terrimesophilobacter sp.]HRP99093.1 phosphoenolpyruvate--protein phosphotransferase [Terrimesophilobacter sp.]
MHTVNGIGVGRGVAVGPVKRMAEPLAEPTAAPRSTDADAERSAAIAALDAVAAELTARGDAAGGTAKEVLAAQALMAADPAIVKGVSARIDGGVTAERAVFEAFGEFQKLLEGLGGYQAERVADLADVAQRTIAHLRGVPMPGVPESDTPFVLIARDLAPADTALLSDSVLALVTAEGSLTSHTAIVARARGIPAIVGAAGVLEIPADTVVVVDAAQGVVTVDPDVAALAGAEAAADRARAIAAAPVTAGALADGTPVPLLANLGSAEEAATAVELGAEGVGLFRTEFLFLDRDSAPTVQEQTEVYSRVLQAFGGRKVVARVLDAGADKPLAFLSPGDEENPALGVRGIRALRANEAVLRDQLSALVAAQEASDAELWVMAPMVSDAEEADYFVTLAKAFGVKVAGVMAEVPSIALLAPEVARVSDFVSIGTNDLTQYTLAADRLLGSVSHFQDPWHPAVLRLIKLIGDAGRDAAKPVGVCGEAAADPLLAVVLVGLGVSTLSMTPAALADVRASLLEHTLTEAHGLAAAALAQSSAGEAREAVRELIAAR